MKFLKIQNRGELDIMGLFLMGASTKRGDESTIGEFGSGWKYALAVLLRLGIEFYIYSGMNKISVSTRPVKLRDNDFNMILINGLDTNYTTEMGPEWQLWMAIREIYSNAMDEGGCVVEGINAEEADPRKAQTLVYIEITPDVDSIIDNWQSYFSFERTDEILEAKGKLKVFPCLNKNKSIIYRKGIKVAESSTIGCFDYDFYNIPINELRVAKNFDDVKETLKLALLCEFNAEVINPILNNKQCWESSIGFSPYDWMQNKKEWAQALKTTTLMPSEYATKLFPTKEVENEKEVRENGLLHIPNNLCKLISTSIPEITILGYNGTGQVCLPASISPQFKERVNQAASIVDGYGFKNIWVKIADFDNSYKTALSHSDGTITLSSILHDKPVSLLVTIILREALIIKSGQGNPSSMLTDYIVGKLQQVLEGRPINEPTAEELDPEYIALPF